MVLPNHEPTMPSRGRNLCALLLLTFLVASTAMAQGLKATSAAKPSPEVGPGWSYRPLTNPSLPPVADSSWVSNGIDTFIRRRLEEVGLEPATPASSAVWLRRASFDLLGLPPTPEQIQDFVARDTPEHRREIIDEMLASPHYGERWARHWLDLVRYAETNGFERDNDKPNIWRYRDWVIDAFNRDLPYDQFVTHQLAGDEIDNPTNESKIATGYYRLMQWDDEPGMGAVQAKYDVLDDVARTTSEVFLGMTIGCARCHDHKKDPIPQVDYSRFVGWFHGITSMSTGGTQISVASAEEEAEHRAFRKKQKRDESRTLRKLHSIEERFVSLAAKSGVGGLVPSPLKNLRYRFYRDTFKALPDFDKLRPEVVGELPNGHITLAKASRKSAIGFVFEGKLLVDKDAVYSFRIKSREPVRLKIGGVVYTQTAQPTTRGLQVVHCPLKAGLLDFRLDWFMKNQGFFLDVSMSAGSDLNWQYTTKAPGRGWQQSGYEAKEFKPGLAGFGRAGTPGARIKTPWETKDIWLRGTFFWPWQRPASNLALLVHHDEDVEIWINGVPAYSARGYTTAFKSVIPKGPALSALRPGANTIAVHCKQTSGGQYIHVAPVMSKRAQIPGALPTKGPEFERWAFPARKLSASADHKPIRPLIKKHGKAVLGAAEFNAWQEGMTRLKKVRERRFPLSRAFVVTENGRVPEPLHVHLRGNALSRGPRVEPGFPRCVSTAEPTVPVPSPGAASSLRRLTLAKWITDPKNPLSARVMANRIWQHHFGRGIVPTPNDFGELGRRPTHPQLLDYLATQFVSSGYSIKAMHRLILSSTTYGMSSKNSAAGNLKDPANDHFWRFNPRRLSAEEVRDSMLSIAGILSPIRGGAPVYPPLPKAVLATSSRPDRAWGHSRGEAANRRSIYIKVKRSLRPPLLAAFDAADTDMSCAARFATTQPAQALTMINGAFAQKCAKALAKRLIKEKHGVEDEMIARSLWLVGGRPPKLATIARHRKFLDELVEKFSMSKLRALETFALLSLNLNAFLYVD